MTNFDRRPERIQVENPDFPYLVEQENLTSHVFAVISPAERDYGDKDRTMFILVNPTMRTSTTGDAPEMQFAIRHTFAGDDENDSCYIGDFTIANLTMVHAYGQRIRYTGWLTEAHFYPDDYQDENFESFNPFVGLTEEDEELDGFPYTPPQVRFGKSAQLPMQVQVELSYGVDDAHNSAHKYAEAIREYNVRVEAEQEAQRLAQEAEKAERKRKHEEWLKTPEGQAEVQYENLTKTIRRAAARGEQPEQVLADMESRAVAYVEGLTEDEKSLLTVAVKESNYMPRDYPAFVTFYKKVESILVP